MNEFFANFRRVDEEFFEELEEMLILSDVGVNVATQLTEDLRYEARLENVKKTEDLQRLIIENLWISTRRMMSTRSRLISKMV